MVDRAFSAKKFLAGHIPTHPDGGVWVEIPETFNPTLATLYTLYRRKKAKESHDFFVQGAGQGSRGRSTGGPEIRLGSRMCFHTDTVILHGNT
jgi:hypothetical protein